MQNKTFFNFLQKMLNEEKINASSISSSVKKSKDFETLCNGGFIEYKPAVTGGGSFHVKDKEDLKRYFLQKFPNALQDHYSAVGNVGTYRNTKAGKRESQRIILVRGFKDIIINRKLVALEKWTNQFKTFAAQVELLETDRICIVENLDSFLEAEKVIPKDYVFIHTYGGLGRASLERLKAKNILVFPDYDFKGLSNYLMVKEIFPNTKLFIPSNYEELFQKYSRPIKTKNEREQIPYKAVEASTDIDVVKIRTDIYKNKLYLEQQALFLE